MRTESLLREIAFPWRSCVDHLRQVGTGAAYEASMRLCREGLMAGPSSGFAYAGLLGHIGEQAEAGTLDRHRNEDGEVVAVFIAPDGPLPYLEEYERYLGEDAFPPVRNAHLLRHRLPQGPVEGPPDLADLASAEIGARELVSRAYRTDRDGRPESLREGAVILDFRSEREYRDHHLPGSLRLDHGTFDQHAGIFAASLKERDLVVLVCGTGVQSLSLALKARRAGLSQARSLSGGTMEWSRQGLPRVRPEACGASCPEG